MRNPAGVFGMSTTAIGYTGMGGSVAYFDPGRRLGVAYLVNQMRPGLFDDPRRIAIAQAIDTAIG
jgi:CubicO group peptidase (beta-lactamase class C family)